MLSNRIDHVLQLHGIDKSRKILVQSGIGDQCLVPIKELLEVLDSLIPSQQEAIIRKIFRVAYNAKKLMELFSSLASTLMNIRI